MSQQSMALANKLRSSRDSSAREQIPLSGSLEGIGHSSMVSAPSAGNLPNLRTLNKGVVEGNVIQGSLPNLKTLKDPSNSIGTVSSVSNHGRMPLPNLKSINQNQSGVAIRPNLISLRNEERNSKSSMLSNKKFDEPAHDYASVEQDHNRKKVELVSKF